MAAPIRDQAFIPGELMMSVAVNDVLLGIVVLTVLGFCAATRDRAAHRDLRKALPVGQMVQVEMGVFTEVPADLSAVRPGSPIATDPGDGAYVDLNGADDQTGCLVSASASGRILSPRPQVGTGSPYEAPDPSAADSPGAAPADYIRDDL